MAGLAGLLWCQGRPQGVRDGVLLVGVRLEACEIVEEAQRLGVESSGCDGDHRHEPVVASLKENDTFNDKQSKNRRANAAKRQQTRSPKPTLHAREAARSAWLPRDFTNRFDMVV